MSTTANILQLDDDTSTAASSSCHDDGRRSMSIADPDHSLILSSLAQVHSLLMLIGELINSNIN